MRSSVPESCHTIPVPPCVRWTRVAPGALIWRHADPELNAHLREHLTARAVAQHTARGPAAPATFSA